MGAAKKKLRNCPAIGGTLTPAECGAGRHGRYECPNGCPFDPFSVENYDQLLETETALDRKMMEWLFTRSTDARRVSLEYERLMARGAEVAAHSFVTREFFVRRDAEGTTGAERFESVYGASLKNDERVLLKCKKQTRATFMETRTVLADGRVQLVDLLAADPKPMWCLDRSLAARAPRFLGFAAWWYPAPHFARLAGSIAVFVEPPGWEMRDVGIEIARHIGAPEEPGAMGDWLALEFERFSDAVVATGRVRHRRMMESMDARLCTAVYELRAPFAECRDILDTVTAAAPSPLESAERDEGFADARALYDRSRTDHNRRALVGRVLLGQTMWRLESFGAVAFAAARERLESALGSRLVLARERIDDVAAQMLGHEPTSDEAIVSPRLLENQGGFAMERLEVTPSSSDASPEDVAAQFRNEYARSLPDTPVPMFACKTPREAVADPALRATVVAWAKGLLRQEDQNRLRTGSDGGVEAVLRELGLPELDVPPPPLRARPAEMDFEDESDEDLDDYDYADTAEGEQLDLPLATLPPGPIDAEEARDRLDDAVEGFDEFDEDQEDFPGGAMWFLAAVDEASADLLDEETWREVSTYFVETWFALVPLGSRAPAVPFKRLVGALREEIDRIGASERSASASKSADRNAQLRQPILVDVYGEDFLADMGRMRRGKRPPKDQQGIFVLVLAAAINVVDRLLRKEL
jgi:hypothetical protein